MSSGDFYSTAKMEQNLKNRKISATKSKVEWLKIQWLLHQKSTPFCIHYKYSNNEDLLFDSFNIEKRRSVQAFENIELNTLYPKGHNIDNKKKEGPSRVNSFHTSCSS
ncbi:unnamed protein product [Psylliodes chrysocephalus]|uniref:Uncharacterized protein n=1 Tax=Psylliodes chrysocephalus TaxID=3402493 RepID=A0A9P0CJC8_9CUCU|nr:unnamed protein product [Psylliodes chrysocephala]